jgi:hypothetical protein
MIKKADRDKGEQKIQEALEIIMALGLPRQQQNERSALTLRSFHCLTSKRQTAGRRRGIP